MKKIDLEQGTAEWHAFRRRHLGASDAASIMQINPYKSREQLYAEKTGVERERLFQSDAVKRGKELEPVALDYFNHHYHYNCKPAVFESIEYPFISASMDGWDDVANIAVEIKVPYFEENHQKNCELTPPHYNAQLQHQMFVLNLQSIFFLSYHSKMPLSEEVEVHCRLVKRDQSFIEKMIAEEIAFWDSIVNNKSIQEMMYADFREMDKSWDELGLAAWEVKQRKRELLIEIKECEREYTALHNGLVELAKEENAFSENFELRAMKKSGKKSFVLKKRRLR